MSAGSGDCLSDFLEALFFYLEQLQHTQGEGLITVRTVGHHLYQQRQGTRQLTHGKHHLVDIHNDTENISLFR